jgi:ribose 5-phosphate isomerase B
MRIALASDHAGFQLKEEVKRYLASAHVQCVDFGTDSEASVDYPDFAARVARAVAAREFDRGILVCGTGIGMAMAANKVGGIRAASVTDLDSARLSREHNDINVLALAGRLTPSDLARQIVRVFLDTPFAGDRHQRRLDKIASLEAHPGGATPPHPQAPTRTGS